MAFSEADIGGEAAFVVDLSVFDLTRRSDDWLDTVGLL